MAFKMKGHTLPGIKQSKEGKAADARAKSSAFQKSGPPGFFNNLAQGKGALGLLNPVGAIASRMGAFGKKPNAAQNMANQGQEAMQAQAQAQAIPQPSAVAPDMTGNVQPPVVDPNAAAPLQKRIPEYLDERKAKAKKRKAKAKSEVNIKRFGPGGRQPKPNHLDDEKVVKRKNGPTKKYKY